MDQSAIAVLRITIPIMIAIGAAIYKTATLRSRISREWHRRVYTCSAGLDELAVTVLYELYHRIGDKLNLDQTSDSWPGSPPLDPSSLQDLIAQYARALKFKSRMESDYTRLMRIGPTMILALSMLLLVTVLVSLDPIGVQLPREVSVLVYGFGGVALLIVALSLFGYVFLQHRLTNAEILSRDDLADA